jgi:hypothetical protein
MTIEEIVPFSFSLGDQMPGLWLVNRDVNRFSAYREIRAGAERY